VCEKETAEQRAERMAAAARERRAAERQQREQGRDKPLDLEAYIEDARELAGTDPPEALVRVLAWLMASRNMVDVAAAKSAAHVLGLERTAADVEAEERRWAAMTPTERAVEMLADPVHGPILRRLAHEQATERDEDLACFGPPPTED
jgi:hypothetical protein